MTDLLVRIAPPNSLLCVLDPDVGALPNSLADANIAVTSSSVVIGTLAEIDGATEVHLVDVAGAPERSGLSLRWSGTIETAGRIAILTVQAELVAELKTPPAASVEVWSNDPHEPDLVWVVAT